MATNHAIASDATESKLTHGCRMNEIYGLYTVGRINKSELKIELRQLEVFLLIATIFWCQAIIVLWLESYWYRLTAM